MNPEKSRKYSKLLTLQVQALIHSPVQILLSTNGRCKLGKPGVFVPPS